MHFKHKGEPLLSKDRFKRSMTMSNEEILKARRVEEEWRLQNLRKKTQLIPVSELPPEPEPLDRETFKVSLTKARTVEVTRIGEIYKLKVLEDSAGLAGRTLRRHKKHFKTTNKTRLAKELYAALRKKAL